MDYFLYYSDLTHQKTKWIRLEICPIGCNWDLDAIKLWCQGSCNSKFQYFVILWTYGLGMVHGGKSLLCFLSYHSWCGESIFICLHLEKLVIYLDCNASRVHWRPILFFSGFTRPGKLTVPYSTFIQYIDDLLLCSPTREDSERFIYYSN